MALLWGGSATNVHLLLLRMESISSCMAAFHRGLVCTCWKVSSGWGSGGESESSTWAAKSWRCLGKYRIRLERHSSLLAMASVGWVGDVSLGRSVSEELFSVVWVDGVAGPKFDGEMVMLSLVLSDTLWGSWSGLVGDVWAGGERGHVSVCVGSVSSFVWLGAERRSFGEVVGWSGVEGRSKRWSLSMKTSLETKILLVEGRKHLYAFAFSSKLKMIHSSERGFSLFLAIFVIWAKTCDPKMQR